MGCPEATLAGLSCLPSREPGSHRLSQSAAVTTRWSPKSDLLGETVVNLGVPINPKDFCNSCRHVWGSSLDFVGLCIHPDLLLGGSELLRGSGRCYGGQEDELCRASSWWICSRCVAVLPPEGF